MEVADEINYIFFSLSQGMGVPLLLDVIRMVQPSHIIQLNYSSQENVNKNLARLTDDFLMNTPGWALTVDDESQHSKNQRLVQLKRNRRASIITF